MNTLAAQPPALVMPHEGTSPTLDPGVFLAPTVSVIGDVEIGADSNIWFNSVLRGDEIHIRIGSRTNIQDGTIIHGTAPDFPTLIGSNATIGHGVILHGCTLEDDCLIGIGATVLDGAVVESGALIAAGAVVTPGKRVPAGEMWSGCPARLARAVRPAERDMIHDIPGEYCAQALRYMKVMADGRV